MCYSTYTVHVQETSRQSLLGWNRKVISAGRVMCVHGYPIKLITPTVVYIY